MAANGPWPWTTDHTARIVAVNSVTPAPGVPNRTAAHRRNGSCKASGAWLDTARSGGSSYSTPPKSAEPITIRPTPTAAASPIRLHDRIRIQRGRPRATPTTAGTIVSCARMLLKNRWRQTVQYGSLVNNETAAASRKPEMAVAATTAPKNVDRRRGVSKCGWRVTQRPDGSCRDNRLGAVGQEQGKNQRQRPPGRQLDGDMHRQHRQQHQPPAARRNEQQSRRQDGVWWPDDRRCGRRQPQQQAENAAEVIAGADGQGDGDGFKTWSHRRCFPLDRCCQPGATSSSASGCDTRPSSADRREPGRRSIRPPDGSAHRRRRRPS